MKFLFIALGVSVFGQLFAAEVQRPNVVFILADDFGCRDLSGEGSSFYETPNLDRIAREGVKFSNGYATCQVCSPSRASIMTGKYPARLHMTDYIGAASGLDWKRNGRILPAEYLHNLPHSETTLAEALKEGGYRTFFAGKWHLGGEGSHPDNHGFDVNIGGHFRGSPPGGFFAPFKNPEMKDGQAGESLPIRLAQETVDFIAAESTQPFFAYLSFYSVHSPIQTTRELWSKYRDKAVAFDTPQERFVVDRTLPVRQVQDCPIYAGMVESMDNGVGMVLETLDRLKLAENTIVIFTSDNGGVSSGDAFATSNLPFRGGKGRQWEGGVREPYYIKAPGIKPGVNETPVTGTDFYPTILELAGLPAKPDQHVDGVSLVPLLKGESIKDRSLFWHYPHYGNQGGEPSAFVRNGDWKLIHYWEDGHDELYDIVADIGEQNDLAAVNPQITAKLRAELDDWLLATKAAIPELDARFDQKLHDETQAAIRNKRKPALERQHAEFLSEKFRPNADWWGSLQTND
ncbi:MAG: sulfatase [Fuerstiella sp.]